MGMTLAEKILAQKLGHEVRAGDVVICPVDLALVQDGTGPLTFDVIRQLMGKDTLKHPDRAMIVLDHLGPPGRPEYAAMHKRLRDFVKATGCLLADGAVYKAMEFGGETIRHLSMDARFTITSMAQECGAKLGLFPSDEETRKWMRTHGREKEGKALAADAASTTERV